MVSNYSDAGQERWLADTGIDLFRGTGRLAGSGVVEVDGVRHTADHVVLANGADPVIPPIPGLRGLEGIWTNREVTGMKAVPRRMLVLGGGPVGVEMAQAVRRFGGEVVLVEGAPNLLPHEAEPLGEALGEVLRRDGIELFLGVSAAAPSARATNTSSGSTRRRAARRSAAGRHGPTAARGEHRSGDCRRESRRTRRAGRFAASRGRAVMGGRRHHRHLAAHPRRQVPGRGRCFEHPRRAARGGLRRCPAGRLHRPAGGRRWRDRRPLQRDRRLSELAKTETYTRAYAESNGFLTLLATASV